MAEADMKLAAEKAKEFKTKIFYINLDNSRDRRLNIERQLESFALSNMASRFPAKQKTEGRGRMPASVLGCLESHLSIIRAANDKQHLVVFEDDVVLTQECAEAVKNLDLIFEKKDVDILFFGQTVLYSDIRTHKKLIQILRTRDRKSHVFHFLEAHSWYRFGTFGYAINQKSVNKISALTNNYELSESPLPIDNLYASLIREELISGLISFPYMVGVNADLETTLIGRDRVREHKSHCDLINMYLVNFKANNEPVTENHSIISEDHPDFLAATVARHVYENLTDAT